MNVHIFLIVCLIVALPRDAKSSELIADAFDAVLPHNTNETDRQRQLLKLAFDDDYVVMDTVGLVQQYGYLADEHIVTSADGYNVKIFRIYGGRKSPQAQGKPVVYIQHGLLASSDCWVTIGEGYDLALLLVDLGYEVWLGNIRGNSYGKSHVNLTTDDIAFWNYSYHEIATLDLPAAIDHVLDHSGQSDLIYIGHSMGTTVSYVILSEMPEYNEKIRLAISLAPIAYWNKENLNLAYRVAVPFTNLMRAFLNFLDIHQLLPQELYEVPRRLCGGGSIAQPLCIFIISVLFGRDREEMNWDLIPFIGLYLPAGISMNCVYHYEQNMNAGVPQRYDYGRSENMRIYGTVDPPLYNFSRITTPFALIYGRSDALGKQKNVEYLGEILPNVVTVEPVRYSTFNHLDFLWARHAKDLLYDRIIELVSMYSNNSTNATTPSTT